MLGEFEDAGLCSSSVPTTTFFPAADDGMPTAEAAAEDDRGAGGHPMLFNDARGLDDQGMHDDGPLATAFYLPMSQASLPPPRDDDAGDEEEDEDAELAWLRQTIADLQCKPRSARHAETELWRRELRLCAFPGGKMRAVLATVALSPRADDPGVRTSYAPGSMEAIIVERIEFMIGPAYTVMCLRLEGVPVTPPACGRTKRIERKRHVRRRKHNDKKKQTGDGEDGHDPSALDFFGTRLDHAFPVESREELGGIPGVPFGTPTATFVVFCRDHPPGARCPPSIIPTPGGAGRAGSSHPTPSPTLESLARREVDVAPTILTDVHSTTRYIEEVCPGADDDSMCVCVERRGTMALVLVANGVEFLHRVHKALHIANTGRRATGVETVQDGIESFISQCFVLAERKRNRFFAAISLPPASTLGLSSLQ